MLPFSPSRHPPSQATLDSTLPHESRAAYDDGEMRNLRSRTNRGDWGAFVTRGGGEGLPFSSAGYAFAPKKRNKKGDVDGGDDGGRKRLNFSGRGLALRNNEKKKEEEEANVGDGGKSTLRPHQPSVASSLSLLLGEARFPSQTRLSSR